MSHLSTARAWAGRVLHDGPWAIARLLLAAWAIGLLVAGIQLDDWRRELSRTLVQLNADAQFRARVADRNAVDPEWYRRKALSLLSASERLDRDTTWTLFVPGSWQPIDGLEEQVQARIAREFGETVVETIRRELHLRAAQLTGVPQLRGGGDLPPGAQCQSPIPRTLDRKLAAAAEDLPEFVAVAEYVAAVEKLDDAVQAFLRLQLAGGGSDDLRKLVRYTLNTELPGQLARSVRLFQDPQEVKLQPALMQSRLQWATRCALGKGMAALNTRLLNTNDLFALEQGLLERSKGLFDPAARPIAFDLALERYRAVHALLEDQHTLLAAGRNDWMRQGTLQLGPAYQQLIGRIARTSLLGPAMVRQLQDQSGAAFAEFRRQFEAAFGSQGAPGIVWVESEGRFSLSPERAGLREGLSRLLKMPFMAEEGGTARRGRPAAGAPLAAVRDEARALADARAQFVAEGLPAFPVQAQPVVARVVDARVSELIYQKAYRSLKAALPAEVGTPLDPVNFRQQRDQVLAIQALLKETGGSALGARLAATLDGELLRRLAVLEEDWRQQTLLDLSGAGIAGWQGEPFAPWRAAGVTDAGALPAAIGRAAGRLDLLGQQARLLLALGTPTLQADAAARRWQLLQEEPGHYRAQHADSSLLRLQKYLLALGSDLRRENCGERLASNLPAVTSDDDIGRRHVELHNALANRCNELRALPQPPAASAPAPPAATQ